MNKQLLFSALIGTALALGSIGVASAGNPTWRYDEESDTVTYAFGGPEIRNSSVADNPGNPQANNMSWRYDEESDSVTYALNPLDISTSRDRSTTVRGHGSDLPWYYN